MRFKNSADALDQVKQQLGVQYVLEGSVRRENDRVRVTAQLIKTQDQTRVWGKEYDRELSNLLGLQAEIAGEIAREVDLNLAAPDGTAAGAMAMRQAVDAFMEGIPLEEYAGQHYELERALKTWGVG